MDRQQDGALPVDLHDVGLRRKTVAYPGDVLHVNGRTTNCLDWNAVQVRDRLRGCVGNGNVVFPGADLRRSCGQDQVLQADRIDHIQRRQTLRLQGGGVEINLHLALFTAIGIRHGSPGHGDELRANEIQAVVVELLAPTDFARKAPIEVRAHSMRCRQE